MCVCYRGERGEGGWVSGWAGQYVSEGRGERVGQLTKTELNNIVHEAGPVPAELEGAKPTETRGRQKTSYYEMRLKLQNV